MRYRFKVSEPIEEGVHRIASQQIKRTIDELSRGGLTTAAVHGSRKSIKRVRALLRLVEPVVSERRFSSLNSKLRDTARVLSGNRDAAVITATINPFLMAADDLGLDRGALRGLVDGADDHVDAAQRDPDEIVQDVLARLAKIADDVQSLKVKGRGFEALAPGLAMSYGRAQAAAKTAYRSGSDDAFHELRKTVQWHWRHMSLLQRAWPDECEVRIAAARDISQALGRDHDLAIARAFALASDVRGDAMAAFARVTVQQQAHIRLAARGPLSLLLAEKPKVLARRFAAYWTFAARFATADMMEEGQTQPIRPSDPVRDPENRAATASAPVDAADTSAKALAAARGESAPRRGKNGAAKPKLAAKTPGAGGSPDTA